MDKKDLEHFKSLLIEERKRILEELDWVETNYIGKSRRDSSGDVSSYSMHPADMGTDANEMEKAYMIGATGGEVLEDIEEALTNIDKGDYGICVECGQAVAVGIPVVGIGGIAASVSGTAKAELSATLTHCRTPKGSETYIEFCRALKGWVEVKLFWYKKRFKIMEKEVCDRYDL